MTCDCIRMMNEALSAHNCQLSIGLLIDWKTGQELPPRAEILTEKIDPKKRGRLPGLPANFCPFCGRRYEDPQAEKQDNEQATDNC